MNLTPDLLGEATHGLGCFLWFGTDTRLGLLITWRLWLIALHSLAKRALRPVTFASVWNS